MSGENLPEDPAVGTLLGETYRLERKIGEGGMATVFEAAHTRIERRFAIKILKVNADEYPQLRLRFEREARIGSQLGHDHIVQVLDFNQTPRGQPYLVMDLLEGEDLGSVLKREPGVPMEWAASVIRQVGSALGAAHEHDVVHRDLKPENIFLCGEPKQRVMAKVLDFGISKILTSESAMTKDSAVFGTPWYMAPEQALGLVKDMDQRTDIFAMGTILYYMLSTGLPFDGPNAPTVLYKIVHEQPAPLAARRPDLPEALVQVVERAMRKKPAERYQSMSEMVVDMDAALGPRLSWARAWGQPEADREVELDWKAPVVKPAPEPGDGSSKDTAHLPDRVTQSEDLASQQTVLATEGGGKKATTTFKIEHLDRGRRWGALVAAVLVLVLGAGAIVVWSKSGGTATGSDRAAPPPPSEIAKKTPAAPVAPGRKGAPPPVKTPPAPAVDGAASPAKSADDDAVRSLTVHSKPAGASVKVNGKRVGKTPLEKFSAPAEALVVIISKPGHATATRRVKAGPGAQKLQVTLTTLSASLTVVGLHKGNSVAADVFLNGKKRDQTPARIKGLKPGTYTLRVQGAGFKSRTRKVTLRPGERRREVIEFRR